jgi:hypothetical protein
VKRTRKSDLVAKMLKLAKHAFGFGHELALHDAIILCEETKRPLPRWALAELSRRSRAFLSGAKIKKKRGRHARPRTGQDQLVGDARSFAAVNGWRLDRKSKDALRGEDVFTVAANELHSDRETVRKAYYRHRDRMKKRAYYVSLAYCAGDLVDYLQHNEELLGW